MADDTTPPAGDGKPDDPSAKGEQLGEAGLKALEQERQARKDLEKQLKELQPLAQRARELEEQSKTEQQKAVERAEAAEKRAAEADRRALRTELAAELGVPAAALVGDDEASMRASAKTLLDWREAAAASGSLQPRRTPPLRSGAGGDAGGSLTGKEKAAAALRSLRTP